MQIYKLLSVLLEYPRAELREHLEEIEQMIGGLEHATPEDQQALLDFIAWAQALPFTELQEHYVKTFDLTPDNALYLTHHLFEEQDRARGPALVKLSEYFQAQGFAIEHGELPDYLPLGMIERLALDHEEIDEHWSKLNEVLRAPEKIADPARFLELAASFEKSLKTHIERENLDFFPVLVKMLSPDQLAGIGQRMARLRE